MPRRVALYARVSTTGQTTENQLQALRKAAEGRGWEIVEEYLDEGISGAEGRDQRPAFDKMQKAATRGEFDLIAAWSLDRLGRKLGHLVAFLDELQTLGVGLYIHNQGLDTTTAAGEAMFQMIGVFAEFEREIIRERIHAGLDRARAKGKRLGRRPINGAAERKIRELLRGGASYRQAAAQAGVSLSVVQRVVRQSSG